MAIEYQRSVATLPALDEMDDWLNRQKIMSYGPDGVVGIERFLVGTSDALTFGNRGVDIGWRDLGSLRDGYVRVLIDGVSFCGTDLGIFEAMRRGEISPDMKHKIPGHEGAGKIVAVGKGVDPGWIGIFTPLDSHAPCGRSGHSSFDHCAKSKLKCDAIVGAIRGPDMGDGTRGSLPDGYFAPVIDVSAGSLPFSMHEAREFARVVPDLVAPSALESWGNIEMIIGKMEEKGLLPQSQKTALIIVGLGATGGVLSALATHYGFRVFGVNPGARKRNFVLEHKMCEVATPSVDHIADHIKALVDTGEIEHVVVTEMSGQPVALDQSLGFLRSLQVSAEGQRMCIVFGLFDKKNILMPSVSVSMPQREWVFQGRSEHTADGIFLESAVGRSADDWRRLKNDLLKSLDTNGSTLLHQLNATVNTLTPKFPLRTLIDLANGGREAIQAELARTNTLKLAVSFRHHWKRMMTREADIS